MYPLFYALENALKNLIRTKESYFTLFIIFLVSCVTFTTYYLLSLFRSWKNVLLKENNFIALLPVNIFQSLLFIIFASLFIFLILYTKNAFRSFFLMQKEDIRTMSFLGLPFSLLSVEFAIQPVICFIFLLPFSAVVGRKIVNQFRIDFMHNIVLTVGSQKDCFSIAGLILIACLFVFFSIFFFIKRLITL